MKKLLILTLCLLLSCVVIVNVTGCGCDNKEQGQETETTGKVKVPDVTGLSVDDARKKLEDSDLDCGIKEEEVNGKENSGKVLSQDPEPGTMLTPDMTVYITVGNP